MNLKDPVSTALLVARALERAGCRYALMGGLLMAAYGEACETRDADVAVVDLTVDRARELLQAVGLQSVVAIRDGGVTYGGLSVGRLTLLGGDAHLGMNVLDIVRTRSPRYDAEAIGRCVRVPLRDRAIQALSPQDFVIFKALATRDRDLDDAASVLRRSGDLLDWALIDHEIGRLAVELPDFEVLGHWKSTRARSGR